MSAPIQDIVLGLVRDERDRQDAKWGVDRRLLDSKWFLILGEEHGEVANALLEHKPETELLAELMQVAAVCVAWAEALFAGRRVKDA